MVGVHFQVGLLDHGCPGIRVVLGINAVVFALKNRNVEISMGLGILMLLLIYSHSGIPFYSVQLSRADAFS